MKWYKYRQNNSAGIWDTKVGVTVFVEAETEQDAEALAEQHGLYWEYRANDCECCGMRWGFAVDWYDTDECVVRAIDGYHPSEENEAVDVRIIRNNGETFPYSW